MKTEIIYTYKDPQVSLVNSSIRDTGLYVWMKSRQKIIVDPEGNNFMSTLKLTDNWFSNVPINFKVGDEVVDKDDYRTRINNMNLQYNNAEWYLFEIQGSCLFRDLCYTLNNTAQWAESNRFLFSILGEDAVLDSRNYAISSEYDGLQSWENQFERYIEAIHEDQIVDHNRLEMPYSISSKFWFGINKKQLVEFLSWMYYRAPFFFEIYGIQMMSCLDWSMDYIKNSTSYPLIDQYRLQSPDQLEEKVSQIYGDIYVSINMGLILYSQFIRQSNCEIKGFINLLEHSNANEFSEKVFKGNSIFKVVYRTSTEKLNRTVSTRSCAFAMSSGDDPCSWSHFLNLFLPDELSPKQLMELLPCSFDENGRLLNCKYHDDIKFRNEGKELRNCPCPLVSLNMDDAKSKKLRDNNKLGDAFYKLTEFIINNNNLKI